MISFCNDRWQELCLEIKFNHPSSFDSKQYRIGKLQIWDILYGSESIWLSHPRAINLLLCYRLQLAFIGKPTETRALVIDLITKTVVYKEYLNINYKLMYYFSIAGMIIISDKINRKYK